jgi:hypothetical protein
MSQIRAAAEFALKAALAGQAPAAGAKPAIARPVPIPRKDSVDEARIPPPPVPEDSEDSEQYVDLRDANVPKLSRSDYEQMRLRPEIEVTPQSLYKVACQEAGTPPQGLYLAARPVDDRNEEAGDTISEYMIAKPPAATGVNPELYESLPTTRTRPEVPVMDADAALRPPRPPKGINWF